MALEFDHGPIYVVAMVHDRLSPTTSQEADLQASRPPCHMVVAERIVLCHAQTLKLDTLFSS